MKELNCKGASLIQYAIILAFISIGVVFGYSLIGQQINDILNKYLACFTANAAVVKQNQLQQEVGTGSIVKGQLGGTPQQPVSACSGSMCSVDYGSFVLNGVPANYSDFIASSGSSGGTDKIADLINQMASQIEADGDSVTAQEFRDIANLGHFLASTEDLLEEKFNACSAITDSQAQFNCAKSFIGSNVSDYYPNLPANVQSLLPNLDLSNIKVIDFFYNNLNICGQSELVYRYGDLLGYGRNSTNNVVIKSLSLLDSVKSKSIPNEYKDVLDKLLVSIYATGNNFYGPLDQMIHVNGFDQTITLPTSTSTYIDGNGNLQTVTGAGGSRYLKDLNGILTPQFSAYSNLDSQLICVTGQYDDTGKACK